MMTAMPAQKLCCRMGTRIKSRTPEQVYTEATNGSVGSAGAIPTVGVSGLFCFTLLESFLSPSSLQF